ncbi:unnamed protein product [Schistosoma mattheei]|uniref:Uncharacterized protein n=1 Tax=Schistosoma mattheei TaxID=31246 RepID=A0A183NGQ0_9TREM|nr:unnamed protein product [Schistosoma mattheei]
MEDVRTRRGDDITSDHHLVAAKMELKIEKYWTIGGTAPQRFNTAFVRDTKEISEFKVTLKIRFQALQDLLKEKQQTNMENDWKRIKEALTSTCQEVLGYKKYHHKEWISTETLDKIKERKNKKTAINNSRTRAEKVKAHAEYTGLRKRVYKSIRTGKQKYMEDLAATVEKAPTEGNIKKLYYITKKLAGKYGKPKRSKTWNVSQSLRFINRGTGG